MFLLGVCNNYSYHNRHSKHRDAPKKEKSLDPSTMPHVWKEDETVVKEKLDRSLMTMEKFKREFDPSHWEDSSYVYKISELGRQAMRARLGKTKQKQVGVVRASFIGERHQQFSEKPEYYSTVEAQQYTDVLTPVQ